MLDCGGNAAGISPAGGKMPVADTTEEVI